MRMLVSMHVSISARDVVRMCNCVCIGSKGIREARDGWTRKHCLKRKDFPNFYCKLYSHALFPRALSPSPVGIDFADGQKLAGRAVEISLQASVFASAATVLHFHAHLIGAALVARLSLASDLGTAITAQVLP